MITRAARLLPWCELASTFLPHNPAEAERIMRTALAVTS
jgi:hypothetical protein